MSEKTPSSTEDLPEELAAKGGSGRMLLTACAFLVLFTLAVAALRWLTPGAILMVVADTRATAILTTAHGKLVQTANEAIYILRPGTLSVRAGEYRIEFDHDDDVSLEFSTGETFRIEKGQKLKIEVKGFPME